VPFGYRQERPSLEVRVRWAVLLADSELKLILSASVWNWTDRVTSAVLTWEVWR
jgi:hypothetical protein